MLRTLLPMNWSQISKEIPSLLVIMSHREWDGRESRRVEKKWGVPGICNTKSVTRIVEILGNL